MATLTLIYGSDWEGAYLDNTLLDQNHRLDVEYVLEGLVNSSIDIRGATIRKLDSTKTMVTNEEGTGTLEEYLEECGGLPEHLSELGLRP